MAQKPYGSDYEMINGFGQQQLPQQIQPHQSLEEEDDGSSLFKNTDRRKSESNNSSRREIDYDREPLVTKHVGNDKDPALNAKLQVGTRGNGKNKGSGKNSSNNSNNNIKVQRFAETSGDDGDGFFESEVEPVGRKKANKTFRDYCCAVSLVFGVALIVFLAFLIGLVVHEDYLRKN